MLPTLRSPDRFLEEFFAPMAARANNGRFTPPVDVHEYEDRYVLHTEVPGFEEKDLKVEFQHGHLTIEGKRDTQEKREEKGFRILSQERHQLNFSRSFEVADTLDADKISASYKQGVLTVTIPKAAKTQPRRVQIQAL